MRFHSRFALGVWFLAIAGFPALVRGQQPSLAPPSLGAAASFAVLGGSAVTSSGSTIVTGNLGVSPGNTVAGFPPGIVKVGDTFRNDSTARQAQRDVTAAYADLAGRTCDRDLSGQDLGGKTLVPGVYCFSSTAQLTGTLILDAANDPNAVWIFQITGTLTTAPDSSVLVINAGHESNIFWQVGNTATLGARTAFLGNVLAAKDITLGTGARVSGRLLSVGAVVLDNDNVSLCCGLITLSPETLSDGTVGKQYGSTTITASGGLEPYTFTALPNSLPPGLTLSALGVLSGTPTTAASYTFTVTATDSTRVCAGTREYTIVIPCQNITVTNPATTTGTSCVPFSTQVKKQFMQTGGIGTTTFSTASTLPLGLVLNSATGVLEDTPRQTGTFPIVVTATDSNGCTGTGPVYNLIITCPTIVVTNPATTAGTAGMPFSQTFTQTGSFCATMFSLDTGTLPRVLTLAANGELSGTPLRTGMFTITVKATDRSGCTGIGLPYPLVIGCQTIVVRNPVNTVGTVGVPFSETFTQRGAIGSATFTTPGPLPAGVPPITLATNGTLSGTPTQSGSFPITVTVTDANHCTGMSAYTLVINPVPPCVLLTLSPPTLTSASLNTPYSETITASGGTAPYTFSVTSGTIPPPAGLTFNTTTGVISGTPTVIGSFNFCITATDANLCTGTQCYTIVVATGGPTLTGWGMLVLSSLLVGAAFVMMRRGGLE